MENKNMIELPVVDMGKERVEVVEAIKNASETWGIFKLVNHGIPDVVLDAMLDGLRRFHDQPTELKAEYFKTDFTEDATKSKRTVCFEFTDDVVVTDKFPIICRKEMEEYAKSVIDLKEKLSEFLSESLGLSKDYISRSEFMKTTSLRCHYYPACPRQDNSSGLKIHSDLPFLAILLQDNVGGLQVLHEDRWVDVLPQSGSLIVNIGDCMQLITNGKYKSVVHRVQSAVNKARLSAASFFAPNSKAMEKPLSPLKELLSDVNPPLYKEVMFRELFMYYVSQADTLNPLNDPSIKV